MVWSPGAVAVEFCDVSHRHFLKCSFLYFDTHLASYTGVKLQPSQSFYMNMKFYELLVQLTKFFKKGMFNFQ